ncbi:C39 family peptidase [Candidatus Saccharibacteria bacterium]|nr:C39 family peptidase [Candidatus Saccharibacteria bacterium]
MQPIDYDFEDVRQTTERNCSQTALAMLMSYYGHPMSVEDVMRTVPQGRDEQGNPYGSNLVQELAAWCLSAGFGVRMHTFDCQIIDLAWEGLPATELINRLEAARGVRISAAQGPHISNQYIDAYLNFLKRGGNLRIEPFPRARLLYELLQKAPVVVAVCFNTLHNAGGSETTHTVLVYGYDPQGNFLVADPYEGRIVVDPERLVCAISAAQIECDNVLFQITT